MFGGQSLSCKGHFFDDTSLLFLTVPQGTLFKKTPRFIKKLTLFAFKPGLQTCSKVQLCAIWDTHEGDLIARSQSDLSADVADDVRLYGPLQLFVVVIIVVLAVFGEAQGAERGDIKAAVEGLRPAPGVDDAVDKIGGQLGFFLKIVFDTALRFQVDRVGEPQWPSSGGVSPCLLHSLLPNSPHCFSKVIKISQAVL